MKYENSLSQPLKNCKVACCAGKTCRIQNMGWRYTIYNTVACADVTKYCRGSPFALRPTEKICFFEARTGGRGNVRLRCFCGNSVSGIQEYEDCAFATDAPGKTVQYHQNAKKNRDKFDDYYDKKNQLFSFLRLIPRKKCDIIRLYYPRESTVSVQISVSAGFLDDFRCISVHY